MEEDKIVEQAETESSEYRRGKRDGLYELKNKITSSLDLETAEWISKEIEEVLN